MRTFIAADMPSTLLLKIDKITSYFKSQLPTGAVKWADTKNLHLTLKFIGELNKDDLPRAKTLIVESLKRFANFTITVGELGMFPHAGHPRIIWLGIHGGEQLEEIYKSLDHALLEIGIKSEKRAFHPHLTIGRVRRNLDRDLVKKTGETLSQFKIGDLGTAHIQEITLFQSELTPQGPIYSRIFVVPLHQV